MSTTLTLSINVTKDVTDSVIASSDSSYKECIENTVIPPAFDASTPSVTITTKTKASGSCMFDDSKFGVLFKTSDGTEMGYAHFHEYCGSGEWNLHSASSKNGYIVDVKTSVKNSFNVTIESAAS